MARYKPIDRSPRLLPIVLSDQIRPGMFEFALDRLVDDELDLTELDAKFRNDEVGATAYDPRVMLKIVLLGYSQGLISSRAIERACRHDVIFIALSGDSAPSYTHVAKFVRELGPQIQTLFTQVLLVCDRLGLIGKELFAIDGVKLPGNASKERSGTHAELLHRAQRLERAAAKIIQAHRDRDESKVDQDSTRKAEAQVQRIQREAQAMRDFVARSEPRRNAKGTEIKSNATDNDSAKMATSKGVVQGYAAQAVVDSHHQVIVAARAVGSGSEQSSLLPMIDRSTALATTQTVMAADAGYHSKENLEALMVRGTPAMIADAGMRKRDERFQGRERYKATGDPLHDKRTKQDAAPKKFGASEFRYDEATGQCRCPAGKTLYSSGSESQVGRMTFHRFKGTIRDCVPCELRERCIRKPKETRYRQVAIRLDRPAPPDAIELMRRAIDSEQGRRLYSRRIGTVEPVFANLRHNKGLSRFTLRGKLKVNTQWNLYCMVHNIEKTMRAV